MTQRRLFAGVPLLNLAEVSQVSPMLGISQI